MKDKFKIIIILLFLSLLSLYAWNLFLYNKYLEIGRYQVQTAIGRGIIDTKTGRIFMPHTFPESTTNAENWYSIAPIRLESEGYTERLAKRAIMYIQAGFSEKEIVDYLNEELYRTGRTKGKKSIREGGLINFIKEVEGWELKKNKIKGDGEESKK